MLKDNEEYGRKFAIGRSKLFLKKDIYNKFLKMNSVLRDKIIVYIQKIARKWLYKARYNIKKTAIRVIQGFFRIGIASKTKHNLLINRSIKRIGYKLS